MSDRRAAMAGLVGLVAVACAAPAPVPEGFAFPRHGWSGGGPAALGSGTLEVDQGCLFLRQDGDGTSYLVVWPGEASLGFKEGVPAVTIGDRSARLGDPVRLGGGYYSDLTFVNEQLRDSMLPPACVTPEVFMTTGFAGG